MLDPSLILYTELNSRGINNLNVKIGTVKVRGEKRIKIFIARKNGSLSYHESKPEMKKENLIHFISFKKSKIPIIK